MEKTPKEKKILYAKKLKSPKNMEKITNNKDILKTDLLKQCVNLLNHMIVIGWTLIGIFILTIYKLYF